MRTPTTSGPPMRARAGQRARTVTRRTRRADANAHPRSRALVRRSATGVSASGTACGTPPTNGPPAVQTDAPPAPRTDAPPAPLAENIAYARPRATLAEIEQAARRAQAHEFIERLPQGLHTRVGERGLSLSGGQRQRLAIARALIADPRVLILDDATSSVDSSTERLIRLALDEAMRGRTTFIIAHRLSTIALADEIVVVDHGRVLEHGDHGQLLKSSELYEDIVAKGLPDQVFLTSQPPERRVR